MSTAVRAPGAQPGTPGQGVRAPVSADPAGPAFGDRLRRALSELSSVADRRRADADRPASDELPTGTGTTSAGVPREARPAAAGTDPATASTGPDVATVVATELLLPAPPTALGPVPSPAATPAPAEPAGPGAAGVESASTPPSAPATASPAMATTTALASTPATPAAATPPALATPPATVPTPASPVVAGPPSSGRAAAGEASAGAPASPDGAAVRAPDRAAASFALGALPDAPVGTDAPPMPARAETPPSGAIPSTPLPPTPVATPAAPAEPTPRAIAAQVVAPLLRLAQLPEGAHRLTLVVAPESVGPITLRAHIGAGGDVRIELLTATDLARDALRAMLGELRRDLAVIAPTAHVAIGGGGTASDTSAHHPGTQDSAPDSRERRTPSASAQPAAALSPSAPSRATTAPGGRLDIIA
ncbi:hypothetical protein ACIPVB_06585 [Microbacterium sp. NPDC090007]|uniref:hypothetical protein n=1 Tax=Microbacterium sp. NPDC090007 TaxID=3364204 RepID=UPI0037F48085